ncbi:hypothetical protein [Rhodococcus triatomae]
MTDTSWAAAGADATQSDFDEVLAWFAQYDSLVAARDPEAMADTAALPINDVTDAAQGHGLAGPCDREKFLAQMRDVVGSGGEITTESVRHPISFLPRCASSSPTRRAPSARTPGTCATATFSCAPRPAGGSRRWWRAGGTTTCDPIGPSGTRGASDAAGRTKMGR